MILIEQAPIYKFVMENYFSYFSTKTNVVGSWYTINASFELPKHMFKLMVKEKFAIFGSKKFSYLDLLTFMLHSLRPSHLILIGWITASIS